MVGEPVVSVIMPAYNGAAFFADAIRSIEDQQAGPLEVIVVDDGSTDELADCVARSSIAVRLLRQPRRGPAAARNLAIRASSCRLIAFLDIDDLWCAGHLKRMLLALEANPQAGFARGLMQQFVAEACSPRLISGAYRMPYLGSCVFQRETLERLHCLDEGMPFGEDYDLLFRCWEQDVPQVIVEEVSLLYRRHAGNMTQGYNREANLQVLQRRMARIRSGAVDPAAVRRFVFQQYIGDVSTFEPGVPAEVLEGAACL